jgi:rsbT antagonist protein RsbS
MYWTPLRLGHFATSRTRRGYAGAETVIVGIQPEVAFAMAQLGLTLEGVSAALDLEEGLQFLDQKVRAKRIGPRP